MIALAHAVVDPRTVVIHLLDAPLADGAMMGPLRLDAATLGALVDHLALFEAHALNVFARGVASRNCALEKEDEKNVEDKKVA